MEFRGYATNDLSEAHKVYFDRTGFEPTAIVVRPGFQLNGNSKLILETRFGAAGIILLTHDMDVDELRNYYAEKDMPKEYAAHKPKLEKLSVGRTKKKSKRGRPKSDKARCPHCEQIIRNFENLGFWYGWEIGELPPYWDELKLYVFERDGFICQYCGKKGTRSNLTAHHIVPKEHGGTDSARNLTTLHKDPCHEIVHDSP